MQTAYPQRIRKHLRACDGFGAKYETACISVESVAGGRSESAQIFLRDLPVCKQPGNEPVIEGNIRSLCFLR